MSRQTAAYRRGALQALVVLAAAGTLALVSGEVSVFRTDQRAYRQFERGDYQESSAAFADPLWKGVALFRQGDFALSATTLASLDTADAAYNRGNALVMQGRYKDAITAYERALELRPDWDDATNNRDIARGRAARLEFEGGDMTGGMMGADDIVFTSGQSPPSAGEEQTEGGQELSDSAIRALWLRQVQTRPADFLAAKFAYQYAMTPADQARQEPPQ